MNWIKQVEEEIDVTILEIYVDIFLEYSFLKRDKENAKLILETIKSHVRGRINTITV